MKTHLDEQDQEILDICLANRTKLAVPLIGDFVLFPTGELERFSSKTSAGFQTSPSGSFYLYPNGHAGLTYGGLNPSTPLAELEVTQATLPGDFWFFHHGIAGGGRGVYFDAPCKVFKTTAPYTGFLGRDFESAKLDALKSELGRQLEPQLAS